MSKIDASTLSPLASLLRDLPTSTPFAVVTDGRKHTGPADFAVVEGVATLTFQPVPLEVDAPFVVDRPYIPPASDGAPE